jgi:hypothetical protein
MNSIQEIFRRYAPEYLELHGEHLPSNHRKTIQAIIHCRSGGLGTSFYKCQACGKLHAAHRSCGNRHCPTCQHDKATLWLNQRLQQLLPCPYFLITFTVPEPLRACMRSHPRPAYDALFAAAAKTLKKLAADPRFVGAAHLGFFGVLHTWGRQLQYHPHLHFVVPGGGLSQDRSRWMASKTNFFVHVKAASRMFRRRLKKAFHTAGLLHEVNPALWSTEFNVNCQAVGSGAASLKYLAPYVFRVAISNHRILNAENHEVTFRYRKPQSRRLRTTTLEALEFIRRFLQHVLPTGFMKIRHYGFLNKSSSVAIPTIRKLISQLLQIIPPKPCPGRPCPPHRPLACRSCGNALTFILFIPPVARSPG